MKISEETKVEYIRRMLDDLDHSTLCDLLFDFMLKEANSMTETELNNHIKELYPDLLEE